MLAESFLAGKVYFLEAPKDLVDVIYLNGKYYWHLPPAPVLLFLPAALLNISLVKFHIAIQFGLNVLVAYLTFLLAYKITKDKNKSLFLSFVFVFASTYTNATYIAGTWYLAHSFVTCLILLALLNYISEKKNFFLIGLLIGIAFLTRLPVIFITLFFLLSVFMDSDISKSIFDKKYLQELAVPIIKLALPMIVCLVLLLTYNHLRFGDFTNTGFKLVNNSNPDIYFDHHSRTGKLFSSKFVLRNSYYYFLHGVYPVYSESVSLDYYRKYGVLSNLEFQFPYIHMSFPGINFFLSSGVIILGIYAVKKNNLTKSASLTSLFMLIFFLFYYWPGAYQIGPRYTIDFLPLLFIPLCFYFNDKKITKTVLVFTAFSVCLNLYLVLVYFTTVTFVYSEMLNP